MEMLLSCEHLGSQLKLFVLRLWSSKHLVGVLEWDWIEVEGTLRTQEQRIFWEHIMPRELDLPGHLSMRMRKWEKRNET